MEAHEPKDSAPRPEAPTTDGKFELPKIPDGNDIPSAFHGSHPPAKPSRLAALRQRVVQWVKGHKKASIAIAATTVIVVVGGGVAAYFWLRPHPQPAKSAPAKANAAPAPQAPKYYSPLTGVQVPNEATTHRQVTAIMIENSPTARPQSGLKDAGIVYEAIAEGGITRFAALYQEARPGLIGPVRSLRPYYLSWITPFDAAIAHVGGSYNALKEVRIPGAYKDIDQFFNGDYYWRATDRYAPHNVYTSFDKLDALNQSKGYTSSNFTAFPRKADAQAPIKSRNATIIDISISSADYNVHYNYDPVTNSYIRAEGGAPHVDREGGQLLPKVVIAIKVPTALGWEDGYREQMTVVGSGQAYIFQDGIVQQATWVKNGQGSQMFFVDAAGKNIPLNAGQTWITATPTDQEVVWR